MMSGMKVNLEKHFLRRLTHVGVFSGVNHYHKEDEEGMILLHNLEGTSIEEKKRTLKLDSTWSFHASSKSYM